ncbi:NUDIX domain-containing protein [Micromonospora sp. FIMYZ51]|uniref:NUDIX domain-containing protein n=1 Tax=Micromonospora sp. FIMYZ51 TaxID=3051832 RepID=UPI00311F5F28
MPNITASRVYAPVDITPPELRADRIAETAREGWVQDVTCDPSTIRDWPARQASAIEPFDVHNGRPVNPVQRTGRVGRDLGRWGENQAADPIVVADSPDGRVVLLIRRDDCGMWAIPGGMVDPGETAPQALVRELREETGVDLAGLPCEIVWQGYVYDPRNSDEAWICSTAALYRLPATVTPHAGSDALDAAWWPFGSVDALTGAVGGAGGVLYAPHRPILTAAARRL